jgi:hypothetical protein
MEQYYTPKIEDIHIGYECELFLPTFNWCKPDTWTKFKISENGYSHTGPYGGDLSEIGDVCNMIELNQVRTLYLTKEQIEAEGWILKTKSIDLWFESDIEKANSLQDFYKYKCYKLFLNYGIHDHKLKIKGDFTGGCNFEKSDTLFEGFCPSINEYRTICKLLNIK